MTVLVTLPYWEYKNQTEAGVLVQDRRAINEAVVPLHLVVPNPYAHLSRIPEGAAWFMVLDLKDTFFCIPLAPESQFLFAFEDPINPSAQ